MRDNKKTFRELLGEKAELVVYRIGEEWLTDTLNYKDIPGDHYSFKSLIKDSLIEIEDLEKKILQYRELIERLEVLDKNHEEKIDPPKEEEHTPFNPQDINIRKLDIKKSDLDKVFYKLDEDDKVFYKLKELERISYKVDEEDRVFYKLDEDDKVYYKLDEYSIYDRPRGKL